VQSAICESRVGEKRGDKQKCVDCGLGHCFLFFGMVFALGWGVFGVYGVLVWCSGVVVLWVLFVGSLGAVCCLPVPKRAPGR